MLTLMIFVVVGFLVLRGLSSSHRSLLHVAGLAVVSCFGLTVVFGIFWVGSTTLPIAHVASTPAMIDVESRVDAMPRVVLNEELNVPGISGGLTLASPVDEGEMLLLPLSQEFVAGLLGPEGAEAAAKLNASISPELRQAYALIPLSATAPQTAGPVVRHALGIRTFLTALSHAWTTAGMDTPLTAEASTDNVFKKDLLPSSVPPEWIENPGIGQTVVQSKFVESRIPAEDALRPAIVEALKHRVTGLASSRFATDGEWEKVVELAVTDNAIRNSFRKTWARTEVIDTAGNPTSMRQTYALIEFPEEVEQKVLSDIEAALKRNRVTALCITLGILWLCAVLLNLAFRAGQHGTFLRKLATVPVMGLLVLPCIVAFLVMTSAMANGRTFEFGWSDNRISCVVDLEGNQIEKITD